MNRRFYVRTRLVCVLFFYFYPILPHAWTDPVLPHLFSDHIVLQQGNDIHLWGRADPAETIKVTLAGKTASAKTGAMASDSGVRRQIARINGNV
jgi:hypothetical protein